MDEEFSRKLARLVPDLEQSLQFQSSQVKQLGTQMSKCLETEKRTAAALAIGLSTTILSLEIMPNP